MSSDIPEPSAPEAWIRFIEERRQLVQPFLKHLTLPTLGYAQWNGRALHSYRQLGHTSPDLMRMQGFYGAPEWEIARDGHHDSRWSWALSRAGDWGCVRLDCTEPNYWTLAVRPASVEGFAEHGLPLRSMWLQLGQCFKDAVAHRRRLLELVEPLEAVVLQEEQALAASSRRG